MRLFRLLNKAARTLGYSHYPNKNVGFLGVVPSSQNLLRACSSSCTLMITESVPPSSQPISWIPLSRTEIEALGKESQDHRFFRKEPVEEILVGGYSKIENLEDPKLIKIANIAVELFNKYQFSVNGLIAFCRVMDRYPQDRGAYVEFLRVLAASQCCVSGTVYRIMMEGIDHGAGVKKEYITKVWINNDITDQKWRLVSFEPTD